MAFVSVMQTSVNSLLELDDETVGSLNLDSPDSSSFQDFDHHEANPSSSLDERVTKFVSSSKDPQLEGQATLPLLTIDNPSLDDSGPSRKKPKHTYIELGDHQDMDLSRNSSCNSSSHKRKTTAQPLPEDRLYLNTVFQVQQFKRIWLSKCGSILELSEIYKTTPSEIRYWSNRVGLKFPVPSKQWPVDNLEKLSQCALEYQLDRKSKKSEVITKLAKTLDKSYTTVYLALVSRGWIEKKARKPKA